MSRQSPVARSVPAYVNSRRPALLPTISIVSFVLALAVGVVLGLPSPIEPVAWNAPSPPARDGALAPNAALDSATVLGREHLDEPEDIAVDADGALYTGTRDGTIWKIVHDPAGNASFTAVATTQGNPLGLRFDHAGNLLIADSERGLLAMSPTGVVTTLLTAVDGTPLHFTNDLDIAADGTIYLSDSSSKFGNRGADPIRETLENRPHGRLIAYDPRTGTARVLLRDLFFANGVTLTLDQSAVLVAELSRYRITRYWLSGPNAGSWDTFADNLPGMPDGIMAGDAGTIWVSLGSLRNPTLDAMHRFPFLKQQMAKLPDTWLAATNTSGNGGLVLGLNEQGQVMTSLSETRARFAGGISNVVPHDGKLYFGTRYGTSQIGIYTLPTGAKT